eukprot:3714353-Pleurochrysis_carterae.AAC.1
MACLRVRGSVDAAEAAKAHPVLCPHFGLSQRARKANSAAPRCWGVSRGGVALSAGGVASMMGTGGGVEVAEDGLEVAGAVGGVLSGGWSSDRGTASSARRCDATTRAKRKFRSGGYAECCREVHPSSAFDPPTRLACVEC